MSPWRWFGEKGARPVLTDIGCPLGDGQVGAPVPGTALVVLFTPAAVGASGVVLTLARQLVFIEDAAVGVKVALAPVGEEIRQERISVQVLSTARSDCMEGDTILLYFIYIIYIYTVYVYIYSICIYNMLMYEVANHARIATLSWCTLLPDTGSGA